MHQNPTQRHDEPESGTSDMARGQTSASGDTNDRRQPWKSPKLTVLDGIHKTYKIISPTS